VVSDRNILYSKNCIDAPYRDVAFFSCPVHSLVPRCDATVQLEDRVSDLCAEVAVDKTETELRDILLNFKPTSTTTNFTSEPLPST